MMVFSLLCFLPGDEDPRFWRERQEASSELSSILDSLSLGPPDGGGLVTSRVLGSSGCSACH